METMDENPENWGVTDTYNIYNLVFQKNLVWTERGFSNAEQGEGITAYSPENQFSDNWQIPRIPSCLFHEYCAQALKFKEYLKLF